jgi:hypothetical protein
VPQAVVEHIQGMRTGGRVGSSGFAMVHEGERVVPAAQVDDRGRVEVDVSTEEFGMDRVVTELRAVRHAVEREMGVTIELQSQDRYRAVQR